MFNTEGTFGRGESTNPQTAITFSRGRYGEIFWYDGDYAKKVLDLFSDCLPDTFADFDRKGRGDSLNIDLYGYDPEQDVAIVQVRQAFRGAARHFLSVHKTYVLVGHNELGTPFRHPVSAHAVRGAIRAGATPAQTVHAAQRWMWGCTEKQRKASTRQGDLLIVPSPAPRGDLIERGTEATLAGSHHVESARIVKVRGKPHIYAVAPTVTHVKGQHAGVSLSSNADSWYTIRIADEAAAWDFSARLGD